MRWLAEPRVDRYALTARMALYSVPARLIDRKVRVLLDVTARSISNSYWRGRPSTFVEYRPTSLRAIL